MTKRREYAYVGPADILDNLPPQSSRALIQSSDDVITWINATHQPREYNNFVIATFIIDLQGRLWVNDRRSEHVLCAAGQKVLSAGEMTFDPNPTGVEVVEVSNQSTGYCPEPDSWQAVEQALTAANIPHPSDFTMTFIFRRCETCGAKNIVKDEWFECGVCQSPLSETWNFT